MSKIFDALKKAKNEQVEKLFGQTSKENVVRVPKYFNTLPRPTNSLNETRQEVRAENVNNVVPAASQDSIKASTPAPAVESPSKVTPAVDTRVEAPSSSGPSRVTNLSPVVAPPPPQLEMVSGVNHPQVTLRSDRGNLVVLKDEPSIMNEQFAVLRAKLIGVARKQNIQTICVTSSVMHEGKTFIASNLALALAAESERGVVIVDCDLRKPSVHRNFGIRDVTGLADFLQSERTNIDSIIIDTDKRLSCIPAGRIPKNPLPLIDSDKIRWLFGELRKRYDFIVIDAPPTAPLADADILGSLADGILFVIKAGETPLSMVQRSLKMLNKHKILGTVLNGTQDVPISYGYYAQGASA
jgi:capsular exopolysaccharide synthesis family protein